ncbi:MAG: isopentenyl-diphosphate Delta-isomerase [Candidatus Aenigmatarchaeota archaeon]
MEEIILVDENDNEIGFEEKIKAHMNGGKLHRAFSIFVFNSKGQLLIQKRAEDKYHFGDLWANTCCSHPRKGETLEQAVHRRLKEEFGFDCELKEVFSFIYKADFKNGLSENEFDHVFIGKYDGEVKPDFKEISEWKWINIEELRKDIQENPDKYTPWFKIAIDRVLENIKTI